MNKIFKVAAILVLPILVELIISCCDCPETISLDYTNCSMTVSNLDNSGPEPVVTQSEGVSKKAYGIRIAVSRNGSQCRANPIKQSLFASAHATKCDCPPEQEFLPKDSILSVRVITKFDFDATHPADSDVSEYFYVFSNGEFTAIDEFIGKLENRLYAFEKPDLEIDLLLMSPPSVGVGHQFTVSIELSDSRVLSARTNKINLEG